MVRAVGKRWGSAKSLREFMSRKKRAWLPWLGATLILSGMLCGLAFRSARHVPSFYRDAVALSPDQQRPSSDHFLQRIADLVSALQREGHWEIQFAEQDLNAWLAVDFLENHGTVLPSQVTTPRVHFSPGRTTWACEYEAPLATVVLSLAVEPLLVAENELALKFVHARAGSLPLPLGRLLDEISRAARAAGVTLRWSVHDGAPVAVINLTPGSPGEWAYVLSSLSLEEGQFTLSGHTSRIPPEAVPTVPSTLVTNPPLNPNKNSTLADPLPEG